MKVRFRFDSVLILLVTVATLALLACISMVGQSEYGGPEGGLTSPLGWHVEDGDNVTYNNMDILLNGDLIIENGGILNFDGVTMYSNSRGDDDTAITIQVEEGGVFNVLGSTITAAMEVDEHKGDQPFRYKFYVYGGLNVTGSTVQYMWGDVTGFMMPDYPLPGALSSSIEGGIEIHSDNVFITDSLITQSQAAGVCVIEGSPRIVDCQLIRNDHYGIYIFDPDSAAVVENCQISESFYHGCGIRSPDVVFRNNAVVDNGQGGAGMGMIIAYAGGLKIVDCEITGNPWYGVWVIDSEPEFRDCIIDNNINFRVSANTSAFLMDTECDITGDRASVDENCSVSHCLGAKVWVKNDKVPVPGAEVIVKGIDGNFTWTRNFTTDQNGFTRAFAAVVQRYHDEWHNMSEFVFSVDHGADFASYPMNMTGEVDITLDLKDGDGVDEPGGVDPGDNLGDGDPGGDGPGGDGPGGEGDDDDDDFEVAGMDGYLVLGSTGGAALVAVVGVFLFVRRVRGEAEPVDECPVCHGVGEYSEEEDDYYCRKCEEYIGDME